MAAATFGALAACTSDSVYSTTVQIQLQAEAEWSLWLFHGQLPFHGPCLAACTFPTAHSVLLRPAPLDPLNPQRQH